MHNLCKCGFEKRVPYNHCGNCRKGFKFQRRCIQCGDRPITEPFDCCLECIEPIKEYQKRLMQTQLRKQMEKQKSSSAELKGNDGKGKG